MFRQSHVMRLDVQSRLSRYGVLMGCLLLGCQPTTSKPPKSETTQVAKVHPSQPRQQPAQPAATPAPKKRQPAKPRWPAASPNEHAKPNAPLVLTHGIAVGDVTDKRAILWTRANRSAMMHARVYRSRDGVMVQEKIVAVGPNTDYTGKVLVNALEPRQRYHYDIWLSDEEDNHKTPKQRGHFLTAPSQDDQAAVTFAWSGDLGGQNVCRDAREGYPIFRHIDGKQLDFFVGLGDMIYADNTCRHKGRWRNKQLPGLLTKAATLPAYWKAWRYNRGDLGFQHLLKTTSYYAVWDDHEVVNDFGPKHDTRQAPPYVPGKPLMPTGKRAFRDYNPVATNPKDPHQFFRTIRWGKHVEFFVLDTRQYRDKNTAQDSPEHPKSMLGSKQLSWFKKTLKASDATWKFVISSVPLSIPTGTYAKKNGHDGWANFGSRTGFERELQQLLTFMAKHKQNNLIWLTTDVHFAAAFEYQPFKKQAKYKAFKFHEFIVGPLSAMLFPNWSYDKSFGAQRLFLYGAKSGRMVKTWPDAKRWMNFGQIHINAKGHLSFDIVNGQGQKVYTLKLKPQQP